MMSNLSINDDSGSENSDSPPSKRKTKARQWYNQPFNVDWLQDPILKEWIEPDPNNRYVVKCKVCDIHLKNANKTGLIMHKNTQKHLKNFEMKKKLTSITSFFKSPKHPSHREQVAKAELLLVAFMAEHNVPFLQVDHLVDCLKKMFPDSAVAKSITMKRTKASYVMQDGIAAEEKKDIIRICRSQKFSVIIDESTDIFVSQILAVVVRYLDESKCAVVDAMLDSILVEDGSAEGLYSTFKTLLTKSGIPLSNIIGFASDNCSTMMGVNNGFQSYLKKDVPSVFVLGCVCHSFALCVNHASNCLPSWLEAVVKNICCYFSRSSKRQHAFQLLQDVAETPRHQILKLAQTRWLSRGKVISRILEQWEALILFFKSEASTDKVDGAGNILEVMSMSGTKHMLLFLNYVIAKVDKMNVQFQAEYFRIHKLYAFISDEYRNLMAMFVKEDIMKSSPLSEIDPMDVKVYKKLEDVDVGGRCENLLKREPLGDKETRFRKDVLSFLSVLCAQIRKRFPLSKESVLAQLKVLDVEYALSNDNRLRSITELASKFPTLVAESDLDDLQDQWKFLPNAKETICSIVHLRPPAFWFKLGLMKDGNGDLTFGLLSKFMCGLIALPHSSACVERIFSQVNMVKTVQTNRLHCETVANRLLAKQAISRQHNNCHEWNPPQSLLEDVMKGNCHEQYIKREEERRSKCSVTLFGQDEVDGCIPID